MSNTCSTTAQGFCGRSRTSRAAQEHSKPGAGDSGRAWSMSDLPALTAATYMPPGRSTRAASAIARGTSGVNWRPYWQVTRSKLAS